MGQLDELYRPSLGLLTDLYQLTMAYGYWKTGQDDREATFHLFFRENPFDGGFAVACGLGPAIEYLRAWGFDAADVDYLGGLCGGDGRPLFDAGFLHYLRGLRFTCDVDAVEEGTVVFANEPLVRVSGPLIQAQIVETALLTIVNFQTLVATKAARVCAAAGDDPVLEFGLRRAQGIDGGLAASRAAHIGGCAATSNVLAGRLYGIPLRGTHAHSWVECFDDEREAMRAYARAMPNNCVFLVDTYDTIEGVRNAVEVARGLRREGHEMMGGGLDSGDLGGLSRQARRILDEAGFPRAAIVGSNDLDEHRIAGLKRDGAAIGVWGVGTRLVTADQNPALGGVYKLSAIRAPGGPWQDRLKLSDEVVKTTTPGRLAVRRYLEAGRPAGDVIYDQRTPPEGDCEAVDWYDAGRRRTFSGGQECRDLLVPVLRGGETVGEPAGVEAARQRCRRELAALDAGVRRLRRPARYPLFLERRLAQRKRELIEQVRGGRR